MRIAQRKTIHINGFEDGGVCRVVGAPQRVVDIVTAAQTRDQLLNRLDIVVTYTK